MKITKGYNGRHNIYHVGLRGYAYEPALRQWELYLMAEDGTIQDMWRRVSARREAEEWANNTKAPNIKS